MFAAIAEMLGYYIDNIAQESFLATALRTSSVIKHTRALDYRIKARNPESIDIVVDFEGTCSADSIIGAGTYIESTDGIPFVTTVDTLVEIGATTITLLFQQLTQVINSTYSVTDGTLNQAISLGITYVNKSLQLTIGGDAYDEVDTFAFSGPTDLHYIVEIYEDGNAYIILGNNINGIKPPIGQDVEATFFTTLGPEGRVAAGQFDKESLVLVGTVTGTTGIDSTLSLTNSSGGTLYEDIEQIRRNAPLATRSQGRMVNRQDHKDMMELVPGVAKAQVSFCCGKNINLYIAPAGGGVPSGSLLAQAQTVADATKMLTTFPLVRPAGETRLVLGANVVAKRRKSLATTSTNVKAALVEYGSIDNQEINGSIRLSDLQALIDNVPEVDYVDIVKLYTKPYARPVDHIHALNWVSTTNANSTVKVRWRVEYDGTNIRVFKDETFQVSLPLDDEYNDVAASGVRFTISAAGYSPGDIWVFTTYPFLQNLSLDDFTLFTILEADLDIKVTAQPNSPENVCS
jgi:hypothetical protein